MPALTVIGVGNRLRGDDAVGPLLIDELARQDELDIELIDAGSDTLGVLEYLDGRDSVIIVDACQMGRDPGDVVMFDPEEASLVLDQEQLSLHGLGLAEALRMAESLEMLPQQLKIIGIQPLSIQLNGAISTPVKKGMIYAMDHVRKAFVETQTAYEA